MTLAYSGTWVTIVVGITVDTFALVFYATLPLGSLNVNSNVAQTFICMNNTYLHNFYSLNGKHSP